MTDLAITITYIMHVVPEWYDPQVLSGEGTLEEQVCAYEKGRIEKDGLYIADLRTDKIEVAFVPEKLPGWCGDEKKHSKHKFAVTNPTIQGLEIWLMCSGKPLTPELHEFLMKPEETEDELLAEIAEDHPEAVRPVFDDVEQYTEPEDGACLYCLSKTCPGSCPESMADAPNSED